jgi:5-methylcytosine-specific restriction endonuclease McrA
MILVDRPDFGVTDIIATFGVTANEVRINDRLSRLEEVEESFDLLAEAEQLNDFRHHNPAVEAALRTAVKWAYKNRLLRGSARGYYNRLREASRLGRCPLCLVREASELDHYLPKRKFPELAIVPLNLVPICDECNGTKLEYVGENPDDQMLHGYYDEFASRPWLTCAVKEVPGAPLLFSVEPDASWAPEHLARVQFHFDKLGLGTLYSDQAAVEFTGIRGYLESLLQTGGPGEVMSYLQEMAQSLSAEPVLVWKKVAYLGWATSEWFCEGGLSTLP